jgi:peptidoglycan/LPS O-acetylase OafA/YrhL
VDTADKIQAIVLLAAVAFFLATLVYNLISNRRTRALRRETEALWKLAEENWKRAEANWRRVEVAYQRLADIRARSAREN